MNPYSLIVMVLFTSISLFFIRNLAPYEKLSKLKFISLNSKFLQKCLIPKQTGYVKVNDRKKISLFSFLFYILFAILVLTLVLMFILPDIPCEEFVARFGKRGYINWNINTLNEKLIYLLPILFCLLEFVTCISMAIPIMIKSKTESKKSVIGMFALYILSIAILVFFIFQLF